MDADTKRSRTMRHLKENTAPTGVRRMYSDATEWLDESSHAQRLVLSFALSLLICAPFCLGTAEPLTDDDYSIAFYLSNLIPGQGLCLFINALLSNLIFGLSTVAPQVSWFFIVEKTSAFLAIWALVFASLSYVYAPAGFLMVSFTVRFCLTHCLVASNITYVAGLASAVGTLYLVAGALNDRMGIPSRVIGVLLLTLGLLWREEMFLACIPFLALGLFGRLLQEGVSRKSILSCVGVACLVVLACGAAVAVDRFEWRADGWREWREYNSPRARISDYPMPTWEDASEDLQAIGLSENDYRMMRLWATADTDVFDTETLGKVADLHLPTIKSGSSLPTLAKSYARDMASRRRFFVPVLLAFVLSCAYRKRGTLAQLGALAATLCMCVYFLLVNRLVDRVETPVWLFAFAVIVGLAGLLPREDRDEANPLRALRCLLSLAAVAVCLHGIVMPIRWIWPSMSLRNVELELDQRKYQPEGPLSTYIGEHPDDNFVLSILEADHFEGEHLYLYQPEPSVARRVMLLGGWGVCAPCRFEQAQLAGGSNAMTTLIATNPSLLIADDGVAHDVLTYLQEHYDPKATMVCVDTIDEDVGVWRYTAAVTDKDA